MGLFSFVKNAGSNLFGGKKKAAAEAAAAAAEAAADNANKATELKRLVENMQLKIENFNVTVDGDKAVLRGKAASTAEREKAILLVGNVEGIAEVDEYIEVQEPAPEAKFHTVASGDSLSKIAKQYYGNPMKYPEIFEANKPMLSHPDKIYPGQVLRIPELG